MLDYFSERFGVVYPYEQYAQVVVEQFIEGGMENLSATTLTERTLHDARAHLDYTSDPLVSHELAHQWWGDLVTCRDWAHIWLNEGFASYFEACWDEKKNGEDAYDFNMLEKAGGALNGGRTTPLVRRRYLTSGETFGGGTYPKGAWVLHMLRRELGEDAFWRGLRAYILEHHGQAVETEDFRRSMEKATARSLGDFFWQWTERAGHPVLDVTVAWDDKDSLLEVSCVQKQEGEPFSFTVDLAVAEAPPAGGAAPRLVPMRVAKKEERLLVPLAARPLWVAFDARQALLKEITLHEDRDQLLAMLTRAPRPILRAEAARALGRDHAPSVVAALGKALLSEPFWAAEEEIARVLGGVPGEEARDALLEGLAVKDPRPRRAVVQALGSFRGDRKVAGALLALLAAGEPSVHVEADAAVALAKTGDPRAYDVLAAMLEKDSSQETLRCAGLRGLGELPDLRGLALARRRMARRNPREVRETAIEVAGRLAARKECDDATRRAVAAEIATILEESHPRLREEAVGALRGLGAESALPALDALAAHDPDEDLRNRARDAAEKIRSGAPPDAEMARLRADLARLAEENAALKDRVERMEARAGAQESKGGAQAASDGAAGPKKNP
jgi:aminopeptidase N